MRWWGKKKDAHIDKGPCVECGGWYPIKDMSHTYGDFGCLTCPACTEKIEKGKTK